MRLGKRFGSYVLKELVGEGGYAYVFRATGRGRVVALKILKDEHRGNPRVRHDFVREAHLQRGLQHLTVAGCYGLERDGDRLAIVLEYCEGQTFRSFLESPESPGYAAMPGYFPYQSGSIAPIAVICLGDSGIVNFHATLPRAICYPVRVLTGNALMSLPVVSCPLLPLLYCLLSGLLIDLYRFFRGWFIPCIIDSGRGRFESPPDDSVDEQKQSEQECGYGKKGQHTCAGDKGQAKDYSGNDEADNRAAYGML